MKMVNRIKYKFKHIFLIKWIQLSKFCYGLNVKNDRKQKIIVSMTTFPKRIMELDMCVKSVLHQKIKPDKFIIYLGNDCSLKDIDFLKRRYGQYGVTVEYDSSNNYMSHKKYLYSLKKYNKDLVITIDDDLVYPRNMIASLIKTHEKFPDCVCARRVHLIKWDNGNIAEYKKWIIEYNKCKNPSHNLFATTGAGTLFPPNVLPDVTFDFNQIKKYALYADDIWIKCMLVLNNTKVVWAENNLQMPAVINASQANALYKKNIEEGKNDTYIREIMKKFNITRQSFEINNEEVR